MNENYEAITGLSSSSEKPWTELGYLAGDDLNIPPDKINQYEIGRAFYQLGNLHYDKSDLVKAEKKFIRLF